MDRTSARAVADLVGDPSGDGRPLHVALSEQIKVCVGDGRLPIGVRLPAERELAAALGISRATVTAAYGRLRQAGWSTARQGAGTWTSLPRARSNHGPWVPAPVDEGVIDMAHAAPSAPPQVAGAFAAAVEQLPRLLPGHGYHPGGLLELRARVAERYTARGLPTTPEQVLVTAGALHGVHVAMQSLIGRGQRLLIDHPTYPNSIDAARFLGVRATPVALDAEDPHGWLTRLERTLNEMRPAGAYLMPDFHNPTGLLLDDDQRARLGKALVRAGATAIVDETLVELALDVAPGRPLSASAPSVAVGSMSKAFWGGLRVGWLRADAALVEKLTTVLTTSHMSGPVLEQLAACALLDEAETALVEHRERLRERREVLREELARHLPDWCVPNPPGGLVLWCQLPARRSTRLVQEAAERGLLLAAGPRFGTGHAFEDRLRLPFSSAPDVLRRAVQVLADADAAACTPARATAPAARLVV